MTNGYNFDALNNTLTISASFAKKASKVGSLEYNIILKLRRDYPNLTVIAAEKKEGKKSITFAQMETFIGLTRDAEKNLALFNKVKKLSRVQPMPYKYVKTWFDNLFPYYSEQPTFDADGYVIDPANLVSMKEMVQEVSAANQVQTIEAVTVEDKVA